MNYKLSELDKEILKIRIELEKTSNKELRKILLEQKKQLERMRELIGSIYMEYGENLHMSDVEKFNARRKIEIELKDMNNKISPLEVGIVGGLLYGAYKEGYYKTAYTIDKGISVGINYKILRKEFIDAVVNADFEGQTYSSRVWQNKEWVANQLYNTIGKGIYEGTSVNKLSKEIKDIFGSSAYQSKRLVNTELARIVTLAQDEIYKDSGVVSKVMWTATLDDHTCGVCGDLDGKIFDINDSTKPMPPIHPSDRCCYIPVVEGWSPKARREQSTKTTISYVTFNEWKEKKNID